MHPHVKTHTYIDYVPEQVTDYIDQPVTRYREQTVTDYVTE